MSVLERSPNLGAQVDAAEVASRRHIDYVVTHLSMRDLVTATDDEAGAVPPDAASARA